MSTIFQDFVSGPVTVTELDDHIALVTINRPHARNAINREVTQTLDSIVQQVESEESIWAVVLTGAEGKVFSAGADLKEVAAGKLEELYSENGGFAGLAQAARSKVWIAAVNGLALAGGFEIVLACDLVVASDTASFGLPEVGVGLLPAAGGAYRLPRALPRAMAIELMLTTERLDAARALQFGLINRVVPSTDVLPEALELARKICSNAPLAVQESLMIARQSADLDEKTLHALSMEAQTRLGKTEDFQEGPRAFIEKRKPAWKGR